MKANFTRLAVMITTWIALCLATPSLAQAHCDSLDGPVVKAAKQALNAGDVTPVLKWVKKEYEEEIRAAFEKTLSVRSKGGEAKEFADRYFFETLVRLHRAGEGAPYTGLKPVGTDPGPSVRAADNALESGSVDSLVKLLTDEVAAGIRQRFAEALERKRRAEESIPAGRAFVEAYVEFMHYAERLHEDATAAPPLHRTAESRAEGTHAH